MSSVNEHQLVDGCEVRGTQKKGGGRGRKKKKERHGLNRERERTAKARLSAPSTAPSLFPCLNTTNNGI